MILIKVPVTPGKRERLLKSVDSIISFDGEWMMVKVKYLMETPKDMDDDYSPMEEKLIEYCVEFVRKSIKSIAWQWDRDYGCYEIELNIGGCAYLLNMQNKEHAIDIYSKLMDWWKEKLS